MQRSPQVSRLPIIGVMGSSGEAHAAQSEPLGAWLAGQGVHLLTGAGGGVMESVSRAFAAVPSRRGLVIGIVPAAPGCGPWRPREGYPNPWVEVPVFTHLPQSGAQGAEPLSRNHINVLSSDVLVALPGGLGTASEARLALRYGRPMVAWLQRRDQIPDLPAEIPVEVTLAGVQRFVQGRLEG